MRIVCLLHFYAKSIHAILIKFYSDVGYYVEQEIGEFLLQKFNRKGAI